MGLDKNPVRLNRSDPQSLGAWNGMCFLELVHNSNKCKRIGWINLCKCSKTRPDYCRGLYQEYRENCYSLFASKVVI